ncbi:MAG: methyl-accepting chemotaxis protein, partial [Lachnospiraceae bacterium]
MEMKDKNKAGFRLLLMIAMPMLVFGLVLVFILLRVAEKGMSAGTALLILLVLLAVLGGVVFALIEKVLKNLGRLVKNFDKIADGTVTLDDNKLTARSDEIGQMMRNVNEMMKSFAKVVVGIRNAADSLETLSEDFKQSFDNMAVSVEQVSREVES